MSCASRIEDPSAGRIGEHAGVLEQPVLGVRSPASRRIRSRTPPAGRRWRRRPRRSPAAPASTSRVSIATSANASTSGRSLRRSSVRSRRTAARRDRGWPAGPRGRTNPDRRRAEVHRHDPVGTEQVVPGRPSLRSPCGSSHRGRRPAAACDRRAARSASLRPGARGTSSRRPRRRSGVGSAAPRSSGRGRRRSRRAIDRRGTSPRDHRCERRDARQRQPAVARFRLAPETDEIRLEGDIRTVAERADHGDGDADAGAMPVERADVDRDSEGERRQRRSAPRQRPGLVEEPASTLDVHRPWNHQRSHQRCHAFITGITGQDGQHLASSCTARATTSTE